MIQTHTRRQATHQYYALTPEWTLSHQMTASRTYNQTTQDILIEVVAQQQLSHLILNLNFIMRNEVHAYNSHTNSYKCDKLKVYRLKLLRTVNKRKLKSVSSLLMHAAASIITVVGFIQNLNRTDFRVYFGGEYGSLAPCANTCAACVRALSHSRAARWWWWSKCLVCWIQVSFRRNEN